MDEIILQIKNERKIEKLKNPLKAIESHAVLQFFQKMRQDQADGAKVLKPQFYHSTSPEGILGILDQRKIEVRCDKLHPGA